MAALMGTVLGLGAVSANGTEHLCVRCTSPDKIYNCSVDTGGAATTGLSLQLYCIRELARIGGHASCAIRRQSPAVCGGEPKTLVYGAGAASGRAVAAEPGVSPSGAAAQVGLPGNEPGGTVNRVQPSARPPSASDAVPGVPDVPSNGVVLDGRVPPSMPDGKGSIKQTSQDNSPPKTVAELAKRAARSSKKQLDKAGHVVSSSVKKAGKNVSKAAKSTWRCLSSFFTDC